MEIRASVRRAFEDPYLHLLIRKRPEVRRVLARRFPYRIFFIVREDTIVIFAVLHAGRHHRHWRARV